ncbi:MAG TPA: SUMF1/EgtB/PvdO family nonheme iron enzyme, partial [Nitrospiria bacterium]|nr:SUMF1/EgtB/PvdO family nonheme iron enzyme [Nitrospiria bacterium]
MGGGFLVFLLIAAGCSKKLPEGMVLIPEGSFRMGTNELELEEEALGFGISKPWVLDASPEHTVFLPSFYMDKYEVTNAEYLLYISETGFPLPANWGGKVPKTDLWPFPVSYVTWDEALNFCRWAGKRLPTEAEWEKAARGTEGWLYPWGFIYDSRRANMGGERARPTPVGTFPRGESPFGVR